MPSAYWDETVAERCRRFEFEFSEKSLAESAVVVAGGTGGLGAALVALLAREGANHKRRLNASADNFVPPNGGAKNLSHPCTPCYRRFHTEPR